MSAEKLHRDWNETCLATGLSAISLDRSAKILAMVYVLGGSHSAYTHSTRLRIDLDYIAKRYGIEGSRTPEPAICPLIRGYCDELMKAWEGAAEMNAAGLRLNWYQKWAVEIAEYYELPKNNSI